jgi:hypothetical protein
MYGCQACNQTAVFGNIVGCNANEVIELSDDFPVFGDY